MIDCIAWQTESDCIGQSRVLGLTTPPNQGIPDKKSKCEEMMWMAQGTSMEDVFKGGPYRMTKMRSLHTSLVLGVVFRAKS